MTLNKIRMLIVITAKKDFPSEQNSLIAMTMLEDYGIHVECAADGEEAVQKFKNLSWDITM